MDEQLIYTVSEVAKILGMNRTSVYKLINAGYLKARKIGSLKITRKALIEFLDGEDDIVFNGSEKKNKTIA